MSTEASEIDELLSQLGIRRRRTEPTLRLPVKAPTSPNTIIPPQPREIPKLLDELPDNLDIDPMARPTNNLEINIEEPNVAISTNNETSLSASTPQLLNNTLSRIKQKFLEPNFNFTRYKMELWRDKIILSESIAYQIALVIPDIVSPPLTDLGFSEHPHLGIYLWGTHPGGLRTFICRLLQQQWLYSFILSDTGFDSDVGILEALSQANENILLIGSDIGSATSNLSDYGRKLPSIVTNIVWDGKEVRTIVGTPGRRGSLKVVNNGIAFIGGGNRPLGQKEFSVRDVSRLLQNEMPITKMRFAQLVAGRLLGRSNYSELVDPFILYTHYLNALIMKGRIRSGIFAGKTIEINIDDLKKRIGKHIFDNWMPQLSLNKNPEQVWDLLQRITQQRLTDEEKEHFIVEEDTNAITRIVTFAYMFVTDTVIDNLLRRPYTIEGNKIIVKAVEEDMTLVLTIMDNDFWNMKRYELKYMRKVKGITPPHYAPVDYYCKILKETKRMLSATLLYGMAREQIIEEERLMSEEEFIDIYGGSNTLSGNYKLNKAMDDLKAMEGVLTIEGRPIRYMYRLEQ